MGQGSQGTTQVVWIAATAAGLALLPWYAVEGARWGAPAFWHGFQGKPWLLPLFLPLIGAAVMRPWALGRRSAGVVLIVTGGVGLVLLLLQGFLFRHHNVVGALSAAEQALVVLRGFFFVPSPADVEPSKFPTPGMGYGALVAAAGYLMLFCQGWALRGFCRGDAFVVGAIGLVVASIAAFVFFPIFVMLESAFRDNAGQLAPSAFVTSFFDRSVWGLDCLTSSLRCGVAWNTVFLAVVVGAGSTFLGLAFALIAARTAFRFKGVLRVMSVLPIITPPFVIGLAVILLFGRAGAVSTLLSDWFDIPRSRWIYGLPGVALAQLLAFTPIAFLVLVGVVQGISPSLEEASQTLRARGWTTFRTVTLPLLRPGLAAAFLLGFVESMADFGNPLVLAGNFEVLSTKIYFAVVGASHDQSRAAVLALVLLVFTLAAFWAQQRWLGRASYTTVTGKGDAGLPVPLPRGLRWLCYGIALPWAALTLVIYATIFIGGFVKSVGRDYSFTLDHFLAGFSVEMASRGLHFTGAAWPSLATTVTIATIAAPLTAAIGLLTAWLLSRQDFAGKRSFDFGTMLSFAIPGTVVGISYILAFNVPPIELTGTAAILVICFVFRNMPVGVRAGIATLAQIDKSLDEASHTLGARSAMTIRRVVLPLLRPAIVAALVYSFVRAMTAVSAVIFLVSAEYNMSTAYIVGRVEAGEFGLAIAYSCVLIVIMLAVIGLIQLGVGERRLGRREAVAMPATA
ncbi:MAG TPA: iron ABC transporter permease [Burkholderiales bacterium]|nr:iron ABC transporter permease [Burkholderiales bacterium]